MFSGVILFSSYNFVYADLVINEIMYDLSGSDSTSSKSREWVEIYNNGSSDVTVDASVWRFYDGGANRTINGEVDFSIIAGAFVIFAGDKDTFLSDHPGFSGVVYDTGMTTLSNTGALLKILDQNSSVLDSFTYSSSQGGAGDGNTLQKISGIWSGATPTPGATNEISSNSSNNNSSSSSVNTSSTTSNSSAGGGGGGEDIYIVKTKKEQKIKTDILIKNVVFTNVPVEISASTTGTYGEPLLSGKYYWNFGDGTSKEMLVNEIEKFSHTYFYPGEYIVNLEYSMNYYSQNVEAIDKLVIKVIEPNVIISKVGDEQDFYIKLVNKGDYTADVSKWILSSDRIEFILPKNTLLDPDFEMIISPAITRLTFQDKNTLKLLTAQREEVYDYMTVAVADKIPEKKILYGEKSNTQINLDDKKEDLIEVDMGSVSDLTSNVVSSSENISSSYFPIISFVVFLGVASVSVYFVRRNKKSFVPGDDFELLDE